MTQMQELIDLVGDIDQNSEENENLTENEDLDQTTTTDDKSEVDDVDYSDYIPQEEPIDKPDDLKRSERQRKVKSYEDYVTYLCTKEHASITNSEGTIDLDVDPINVQEALSRPDGEKWKEAMENELKSVSYNEAWDLVDHPENGFIADNKWVFKRKRNSVGNVCYRARLVTIGFVQTEGVDYSETFSPVVRHSTLRLFIAVAAKLDLDSSRYKCPVLHKGPITLAFGIFMLETLLLICDKYLHSQEMCADLLTKVKLL